MGWNWSSECKKAFEKIKNILTSNLSLMHFNLNIVVASDPSNYGGGAAILHKLKARRKKQLLML